MLKLAGNISNGKKNYLFLFLKGILTNLSTLKIFETFNSAQFSLFKVDQFFYGLSPEYKELWSVETLRLSFMIIYGSRDINFYIFIFLTLCVTRVECLILKRSGFKLWSILNWVVCVIELLCFFTVDSRYTNQSSDFFWQCTGMN